MLHVLQSATLSASDAPLRAMFAARKSVFVDLLRWDVHVRHGQYEIDQFDDAHATYLVLTAGDGSHLGSARLLPTMRPHILGSLYPDLCEGPPPRGETIFEITRFCLDRRLRAPERRQVRDTLVGALAEHALTRGITAYSAIAQVGWSRQILAFGWQCRPLGPPQAMGGAMLAALRIDISSDTPALLAAGGIIPAQAILGESRAAA
jgi:acyl-homoserine lactone synthase